MKNEMQTAVNIVKIYGVAKEKGILSINKVDFLSDDLKFMIDIVFECLQKNINIAQLYDIMNNYEGDFENEKIHKLIANGLMCIVAGENIEYLIELEASILGRKYRTEFIEKVEDIIGKEDINSKIIEKYIDKKPFSENTDLLESVLDKSDKIKLALNKMNSKEIKCILMGVSGKSAVTILKVLEELDNRVLKFIDEDLQGNISESEQDIIEAERKFINEINSIVI